MATIGTFTKTDSGYTGTVKTLSLNVKTVKFIPTEGESERGPDFRIFAGATDYAWRVIMRSLMLAGPVFRGFCGYFAPHNIGVMWAAPPVLSGAAVSISVTRSAHTCHRRLRRGWRRWVR